MRYALPSFLLASPAFAHPGHHAHPHDGGAWLLVVLLLALAGGSAWAAKMRK